MSDLPFGKRYGLEPLETPIQLNDLSTEFRIDLWNAFHINVYGKVEERGYGTPRSEYRVIHKNLWIHFFGEAIDDFPEYDSDFRDYVRRYIQSSLGYKVYEFFEYTLNLVSELHDLYDIHDFNEYLALKLKRNNCGYTIINNRFVPITNKTEIEEIISVQKTAGVFNLGGVQEHLQSALRFLSAKPTPEYRNSIKESISMVEAICKIIVPENTLGKALNTLNKDGKINSVLKNGFEKLYAYTNDKNGIRHAIMEDESIEVEDARFFLVSCSAFTNYLIEKANKEGLLKR